MRSRPRISGPPRRSWKPDGRVELSHIDRTRPNILINFSKVVFKFIGKFDKYRRIGETTVAELLVNTWHVLWYVLTISQHGMLSRSQLVQVHFRLGQRAQACS